VTNDGPDRRTAVRVMEMPPATAQLVSARASQGACSVSAIATCELGSLAAGSEAFVTMTVRAATEGDVLSTVTVSGQSEDRTATDHRQADATTRLTRYTPSLTLIRPAAGTQFRLGRNNTVQWILRGATGGVSVDLSRDDGATWTRLSDDAENIGFYDWTGVDAVTSRAKIRLTSVSNPSLTQTSSSFSIVVR
jgi:hypothetical protein